jgi:glucokinase
MAAIDAYETAGVNLANAVAHMVKVLDVRLIVIGGGMSQAWDLLAPAFQGALDAALIPLLRGQIEVRVSTSGDQAGIIGAALLSVASR